MVGKIHNRLKVLLGGLLSGLTLVTAVAWQIQPAHALDLSSVQEAIGGKFAPGLDDIFTPDPFCGTLVTVIQPDFAPVVLTFAPTDVKDWFYATPSHVGNSTLGLAIPNPDFACPPIYYMFGSSIAP